MFVLAQVSRVNTLKKGYANDNSFVVAVASDEDNLGVTLKKDVTDGWTVETIQEVSP